MLVYDRGTNKQPSSTPATSGGGGEGGGRLLMLIRIYHADNEGTCQDHGLCVRGKQLYA